MNVHLIFHWGIVFFFVHLFIAHPFAIVIIIIIEKLEWWMQLDNLWICVHHMLCHFDSVFNLKMHFLNSLMVWICNEHTICLDKEFRFLSDSASVIFHFTNDRCITFHFPFSTAKAKGSNRLQLPVFQVFGKLNV